MDRLLLLLRRWLPRLLALCLLLQFFATPRGLATSDVSAWSWFHYWINGRYFEELGYEDLYEQAVAVHAEQGRRLGKLRVVRDLRTYDARALDPPPTRSPAWTDERWQAFGDDIELLIPMEDRWSQVLRDRGFNGSPAWVGLMRALDGAVDLGSPLGRWIGTALDPALVGLAAWFLIGTFGPIRGSLAGLALLLWPTTVSRLPGCLLQYDVTVLVLLSAGFLARGRHGVTGVLLGVATALRLFPAVFIAALLARAVVDGVDGRPARPWLRFGGGAALGLAAALLLGALGPRGPQAWREFADNTLHHQELHKYGDGRVGLEHLFTVPAERPSRPPRSERIAIRGANELPLRLAQALLLVLVALAARRADAVDTLILATVAFFALAVSSRYYWTVIALWPLLRRGRPGWLPVGAAVAFGASAAFAVALQLGWPKLEQWLLVERVLLACLVLACATLLGSSVRRLGLRRWLLPGPTPTS